MIYEPKPPKGTVLVRQTADGSAYVVLEHPTECPACHRMATFVVNRHGKTLCLNCDEP
jgi:hypothetical protein